MNRQATAFPALSTVDVRFLKLLFDHADVVKQVKENGGSIREICKMTGRRYSEVAELLAAIAVLEEKFQ